MTFCLDNFLPSTATWLFAWHDVQAWTYFTTESTLLVDSTTEEAAMTTEGTVNLMIEPTGSYTGLLRAAAMRQPWHP